MAGLGLCTALSQLSLIGCVSLDYWHGPGLVVGYVLLIPVDMATHEGTLCRPIHDSGSSVSRDYAITRYTKENIYKNC